MDIVIFNERLGTMFASHGHTQGLETVAAHVNSFTVVTAVMILQTSATRG